MMFIPGTQAWVCGVCGYVHYGPKPPEECPVCGAIKDFFEPYTDSSPAPVPTASNQWRCVICGFIGEGIKAPELCPICQATANFFETFTPEASSQEQGTSQRILIIGAGIAGVSAAESVRKTAPQAEISLISKELLLPYYRLNLTRYLAGEINADQLLLHPETWYTERGIHLKLGEEIETIDLGTRQATDREGKQERYDKLILTAGSHPFVPPIPGKDRGNVVVLRTKADAEEILNAFQKVDQCVCIGGGLLGLETAGALARRGIEVTILEGFGWLLPRQLNQKAGDLLETIVNSKGISLRKKAQTQEIVGDDRVNRVLLNDGSVVLAGLVVFSTGVRSNSYLARLSGLDVNNGVVVDNTLCTSHPGVYAAGDIAEHRGVVYGIWGPAQYQGSIAGMNAAGVKAEFVGVPTSNKLKVLGVDLFSIGQVTAPDASFQVVEEELDGKYFCFIFHDNTIIGSILLGDTSLSANVKHIIEKRLDCSKILQKRPGVREIFDFLGEIQ